MSKFEYAAHSFTNRTVTVISTTAETYSIKSDAPTYKELVNALIDGAFDSATLEPLLCAGKALEAFTKGLFTYANGVMSFRDGPIPAGLNDAMVAKIQAMEDPEPLMRFFTKLNQNPSFRSVTQAYDFVSQTDIEIAPDGDVIGFKKVKSDYFDCYTGESFCYKSGAVATEPRNQISDDPDVACAKGLHVGAMEYVRDHFRSGTGRIIRVKVNPRDIVAVPKDYSCQKMRVCRLVAIGDYVEGEAIGKEFLDAEDILEPKDTVTVKAPATAPVVVPNIEEAATSPVGTSTKSRSAESSKTIPFSTDPAVRVGTSWAPLNPSTSTRSASRAPSAEFAALDKMDSAGLMTVKMKILRKYCSGHLGLTGSAHFGGGKKGLVDRIVAFRKAPKA